MNRQLPRLHAVTNDAVLALTDFTLRAAQITTVPETAVHLRSGSIGGRDLCELADSMRSSCGADTIFLNDRADAARATGAAGVHLPSAGLPVAAARSIVGPDMWIGRSTHDTEAAARAADEGANYVFLGPIWATASHPGAAPLGPAVLSAGIGIPVIAIGGITPEKVRECVEAGAYGVAAITALWYARDAASTARTFSLSFPS